MRLGISIQIQRLGNVMKKKFQEEECLQNDSQFSINGGKDFSQNLSVIQDQCVDESMVREDHIPDKQQQQYSGLTNQNSRRFKYSLSSEKVINQFNNTTG
ncbi:hypothetical protein ABPG72_020320 [Tetrahymena utriculariae]